jgi:hypothetical protein
MTQPCKNCNHHFKGNYCDNCGQSAHIEKLDFHYLWHEFQHGFLHFDKGVLYTASKLFISPGVTIREFIEGKRVNHFKPLSYVIILATLYGFLYHIFIKNPPTFINIQGAGTSLVDASKINEWLISHYSILALLGLPLDALCSFIAFKRSGYNYVENLVLNAFIKGQVILIQLIFIPVVLIFGNEGNAPLSATIPLLLGVILTFWAYIQFFIQIKRSQRFWRAVLAYGLYFLLFLLFIFVGLKLFLLQAIH